MEPENTRDMIQSLPEGYFNKVSINFMITMLQKTRDIMGAFLEVGSFLGRSSVIIGTEAKRQKEKLYCIDSWKKPDCPDNTFGAFVNNMKNHGLQETVIPIQKESEPILKAWDEYWKEPLRFIHIDGCHDYEPILIDTGWKKYLSPGGIICFHDYCDSAPGVIRAVNEELVMDENFIKIGIRHSLIAFRKRNQ